MKSMNQLPGVGWRLFAEANGSSLDWIIAVSSCWCVCCWCDLSCVVVVVLVVFLWCSCGVVAVLCFCCFVTAVLLWYSLAHKHVTLSSQSHLPSAVPRALVPSSKRHTRASGQAARTSPDRLLRRFCRARSKALQAEVVDHWTMFMDGVLGHGSSMGGNRKKKTTTHTGGVNAEAARHEEHKVTGVCGAGVSLRSSFILELCERLKVQISLTCPLQPLAKVSQMR